MCRKFCDQSVTTDGSEKDDPLGQLRGRSGLSDDDAQRLADEQRTERHRGGCAH